MGAVMEKLLVENHTDRAKAVKVRGGYVVVPAKADGTVGVAEVELPKGADRSVYVEAGLKFKPAKAGDKA